MHNDLKIRILSTLKERKIKRTKLAEETGIPYDRLAKWFTRPNSKPKAEDTAILEEWLNGQMSNTGHYVFTQESRNLTIDESFETYLTPQKQGKINDPVIVQLSQALADLAKANKDQAEKDRIQAETNREMIELYKKLYKDMAREKSSEEISSNLNVTLAGVETLSADSERQEKMMKKMMEDLAEIKSRTAVLFPDGGKK